MVIKLSYKKIMKAFKGGAAKMKEIRKEEKQLTQAYFTKQIKEEKKRKIQNAKKAKRKMRLSFYEID